jgi:SP family sugar:H+ symporter-like MFS transporter
VCIAFVYFFIYETKGLTLEEIDTMYQEVSVAHRSTKWAPTSTFRERLSVAHQGGLGADGKPLAEHANGGMFEHSEGEKRSDAEASV